eukprot:m.212161 g.212161  ORF g.212161 m.212161 type:complete len:307 (+) comp19702_c0_seq1:144-1064(+)
MEVDGGRSVVTTAVEPSVSVQLHPLPIMSISEHYTRIRAQTGQPQAVFGALLGRQEGRKLEIANSFELLRSVEGGVEMLDTDHLDQKYKQFQQVFPTLTLLGWYTTGSQPTAEHINMHKQIMQFNETPLFLLLNPSPNMMGRELPVKVYDSYVEMVEGKQEYYFIDAGFTLATEEAERIGVNHIEQVSTGSGDNDTSEVSAHLMGQYNAIRMLLSRVLILKEYLADVSSGALPMDHSMMRSISTLCSRLPAIEGAAHETQKLEATNDTLLMSCLASITKGCNALNEMLDRFAIANERQGNRRARWQ